MRTSGSFDYNMNRNQIIETALGAASILGVGQTPRAYQINKCSDILNMMLGYWQTMGINVAMIRDIVIFPRYGIGAYPLGPNGYDAADYYFQTTLNGDHSEGDTFIALNSNLSDNDGICNAQRLSGAVNLYLNGAYCSGGVAVVPIASRIAFYSTTTESNVVFTVNGTSSTGATQDDTVTLTTAETYVSTTKTFKTVTSIACSAATAGYITVGSHGIAQNDYIIIQMDDGTTHRDIISSASINLSGCCLAISTDSQGLPSDSSDGNAVFVYRNKISKPLDILSARTYSLTACETNLTRLRSRDEYFRINDKTTRSTPACFFYDPGVDVGTFYLWPTPNDVTSVIKAQARMPIDDMDNSADNAYFPREWCYPIAINLAVKICPHFSKSASRELLYEAERSLKAARGSERTQTCMQFIPPGSR